MKEITLLKKFPIVITKDPKWGKEVRAEEGAIIILPEDAVLVEAKNGS